MVYAVCVWPKRGGMMVGWAAAQSAKEAVDMVTKQLDAQGNKERFPPGTYSMYAHPAPPEDALRASPVLTYSLEHPVEQFTLTVT